MPSHINCFILTYTTHRSISISAPSPVDILYHQHREPLVLEDGGALPHWLSLKAQKPINTGQPGRMEAVYFSWWPGWTGGKLNGGSWAKDARLVCLDLEINSKMKSFYSKGGMDTHVFYWSFSTLPLRGNCLVWNYVQISMVSRGWILKTSDFPLTFHLVPPVGQSLHLSSQISDYLLEGLA